MHKEGEAALADWHWIREWLEATENTWRLDMKDVVLPGNDEEEWNHLLPHSYGKSFGSVHGLQTVETGWAGETVFALLLLFSGRGKLKFAQPEPDSVGVDFIVWHVDYPGLHITIQVKTAMTVTNSKGSPYIETNVPGKRKPHPSFLYFIGYLNPTSWQFENPIFLVPSTDLHRLASGESRERAKQINFAICLSPNSRDRWQQFRLTVDELADRLAQWFSLLYSNYGTLAA